MSSSYEKGKEQMPSDIQSSFVPLFVFMYIYIYIYISPG